MSTYVDGGSNIPVRSDKSAQHGKPDYEYRYNELKKYVLDYLSEVDNPVPDYNYRRTLRNHIRVLAGAPSEPAPRR